MASPTSGTRRSGAGMPRVAHHSTAPASANEAASTISALAGPTSATSPPATAAPTIEAVRSTAPVRPVTRSVAEPVCSTTAGIRAWPAASPGPRSAPATATAPSSTGNESMPARCSTGIIPTTTVLAALQLTAIRRAPIRSVSGPESTCAATSGAISAKATRPVLVGEPVVVRTSHGIAIIDTRVPVIEIATATR